MGEAWSTESCSICLVLFETLEPFLLAQPETDGENQ